MRRVSPELPVPGASPDMPGRGPCVTPVRGFLRPARAVDAVLGSLAPAGWRFVAVFFGAPKTGSRIKPIFPLIIISSKYRLGKGNQEEIVMTLKAQIIMFWYALIWGLRGKIV